MALIPGSRPAARRPEARRRATARRRGRPQGYGQQYGGPQRFTFGAPQGSTARPRPHGGGGYGAPPPQQGSGGGGYGAAPPQQSEEAATEEEATAEATEAEAAATRPRAAAASTEVARSRWAGPTARIDPVTGHDYMRVEGDTTPCDEQQDAMCLPRARSFHRARKPKGSRRSTRRLRRGNLLTG